MSGRSKRGFIFTLDALISLTIVALLISALDFGTKPIPDYTELETSRLANNLMEACAGHLPMSPVPSLCTRAVLFSTGSRTSIRTWRPV